MKTSPATLFAQIELFEEFDLASFFRNKQHLFLNEDERLFRRPIHFSIPSFKSFQSTEISCSGKNRWPAISVTGADCKLQCDHCKARILEPMLLATSPQILWDTAATLADQGARGFLLTGGSNHRNQVEYEAFLPVVSKIKVAYPHLRIACHTALMTADEVTSLEQSGVDVAMMDIIGAQDTITQVYHLRRRVDDFEETLASLTESKMTVVPHIVLGLHYGYFLGEWNALEIVRRYLPDMLVLVIVMPMYADKKRPFKTPHLENVERMFRQARKILPDTPIKLGCARPPGRYKAIVDSLAVLSGLDGIAYPAEGIVELASRIGREVNINNSCCSISDADDLFMPGSKVEIKPQFETSTLHRINTCQ